MSQDPDFVARLATLMAHYHLSASALADAIGVQRSGISHLVSGRNKPGLDFILKLSERFPEVNLYWLLKGEGPFLREDAQNTPTTIPTPAVPTPTTALAPQPTADSLAASDELLVLYPDGTYQRYRPK
ncbi:MULTISPECIES: helix-turn-helix domain-containing protein [unclassified Flavobacterium]|uniref:helix-turn-helix domain-containing protein n=1 Tax=unclassified Flavobacterium TaxID=196869 RepID=UPI001F12E9DE|nr:MULTISPECIES: helix-turn-helix transcriptional regulator [unclassified Flavobacterium]UMY65355.1 helix-turn-helix domain-containing protein [Flavobacterium sp. HJ-32-4]